MIVALTGGRAFLPAPQDEAELRDYLARTRPRVLRHGGCSGADTWAHWLALSLEIPIEVWPATDVLARCWRDGSGRWRVVAPPPARHWPAAGPLRNRDMVRGGDPPARPAIDELVAFPGSTGTRSCMLEAIAAGAQLVRLGGWR